MSRKDYSYMDLYKWQIEHKKRFRDTIPKDKITEELRQIWDYQDQCDSMLLRYYQGLEQKRLERLEQEESLMIEKSLKVATEKALKDVFKDWK